MSKAPSFIAQTTTDHDIVAEAVQRLREKLLVTKKIATYSGRGPLAGFVRVAAIRMARDVLPSARAQIPIGAVLTVDDPELDFIREKYRELFSTSDRDGYRGAAVARSQPLGADVDRRTVDRRRRKNLRQGRRHRAAMDREGTRDGARSDAHEFAGGSIGIDRRGRQPDRPLEEPLGRQRRPSSARVSSEVAAHDQPVERRRHHDALGNDGEPRDRCERDGSAGDQHRVARVVDRAPALPCFGRTRARRLK